jgi:hypothetical protein
LSTLTKVLIVLLTIFSIFLCGIVVTYVSHAENQKDRADNLQKRVGSAERMKEAADKGKLAAEEAAQQSANEAKLKIAEKEAQITDLMGKIEALNTQKTRVEQDMAEARAKAAIDANLAASLNQQYTADETEIKGLKAEKIQRDKELAELQAELMAKLTQLAQRDEEKKQLAEANQDLRDRLDQYLQKYGVMATSSRVATAATGSALPVAPQPSRDILLKGLVSGVDLQNNVAQISLGSASGVKPNMTFHVMRGEQFICDIVIQRVDPDKAIGRLNVLDRNRAEPRVGDAASTNL